jgi:hypothetical protein
VLQALINGLGVHGKITCPRRNTSDPGAGVTSVETQACPNILFAPLRGIYLLAVPVTQQAYICHAVPRNGILTFIESPVEQLDVGVGIGLKEEAIQFQVHIVTAEEDNSS